MFGLPAHRRPGVGGRRHAGSRGFLLGGTAGRTTLNGEGLQHEDGHSHVLAGTIPNCVSYDPTFAHEVGVIMHDGLKRMVEKQEDVYYYVTVMNENYRASGDSARRAGRADHQGHVPVQEGRADKKTPRVNLMGAGTILNEVIAAAELLKSDWGVAADLWSCPSFTNWRATARPSNATTCCTRPKRRRSPT